MRTARVIELTDEQRQQLQRLARSNTVSVRLARRAEKILQILIQEGTLQRVSEDLVFHSQARDLR